MTEHEAQSRGTVNETGHYDSTETHRLMNKVALAVEEHGEVHATFEGVDAEVELRLGTTLFDYDTLTFDVWDGDNYVPFAATRLVSYYKPMAVYHE